MFSFAKIDLSKLPIKNLIIILLGVICVTSIQTCRVKSIAVSDKGLEMQFAEHIQKITKEKNALGQEVALQKSLVVSKDKELEKTLLANSNLKSISNHYETLYKTSLNGQGATYMDVSSAPVSAKMIVDRNDTSKYIKVGTTFKNDTSKWFKIFGTIKDRGIIFDSLYFYNNLTINIGYKRKPGFKGYFQKDEQMIENINPNPYTEILSARNISFKPDPKKFYQTQWFAFTMGVLAKSAVDIGVRKYIVK